MSFKSVLVELLAKRTLSIPKAETHWAGRSLEQMTRNYEDSFYETRTSWIVHCTHRLNPPATENEVAYVAKSLERDVPDELRKHWRISNGAELYVTMFKGEEARIVESFSPGASRIVGYKLLGTSEIIRLNHDLFANFRECLGVYPEYQDILQANYIAFCDAGNANYQSILLEGPDRGKVILLHHEFCYCPHDETCILNDTLAESLESWFQLIVDTDGFGGGEAGVIR